jgi:Family of unknown function (DUF5320)
MPGGDRTGPTGAGPRTGRGMGYCSSNDQPGYAGAAPAFRCGFGFRRAGMGRGWRHRFYATGIPGWVPPTQEQETADLKAQADLLKTQLDAIQKRLKELEA